MTAPDGPPSAAPLLFWLSLLFILYTYAGYPLLMAGLGRWRRRSVARDPGHRPEATVLLAARNEARVIARRIENLLGQDYPPERLKVVAVSDGSTDETGRILREIGAREPRLRVVVFDESRGKAAALNAAAAEAGGELLVFTDSRQEFAPDAVARLAENFADPAVGSASGELILKTESGVGEGMGVYWAYEKWIRQNESRAGSMLGATGAIYAIRRELWAPLPEGTILDDLIVPMRIVLGGRRAVFDGRAVAWDRAEDRAAREFRRKVRTLAGNFQAFAIEPRMLAPWRNRATWFQLWSHKVFRLLVPWALVVLVLSSLLACGAFYTICAVVQTCFYLVALAGLAGERLGHPARGRVTSLAVTFITLNAAAACGLLAWIQGRSTGNLWRR